MNPRFACLLGLGAVLALPGAAESTRTLRLELQGDPAKPFSVENLAGTMKVAPGAAKVSVQAIVHAESDAVAAGMQLQQVVGEKGEPTLRLIYPEHDVRYPQGSGRSDVTYGGERYRVSASRGTLAWAELLVEVPAGAIDGRFRNRVGGLSAEGLHGQVLLDTASGDISVAHVQGDLRADTGSGNVSASDLSGSFDCDTGSGDCSLQRFEGERLDLDTGSGAIRVSAAKARKVKADTGSGRIALQLEEAQDVAADTGSGDVLVDCACPALARVKVDTGSGDVTLRVPPATGFELRADQGSGELQSGFAGAEPILRRREVVGYRFGDGQTKLDVDTGSGDVRVEPTR